ncbi:MAG: PIN domain-containing protein [Acidimicrobiia bacterium]|nr:PIN domain-containing protein [Acidimicrobiia bacterium]
MPEPLVVDASAWVNLLGNARSAPLIADRLRDCELHAPAHLDAEVLSGLGRLHRAGGLTARQVETRLARFARSPVTRHALGPLLAGAWQRRHRLSLPDALYAELAETLQATLVTADAGLAAAFSRSHLVADDRPPTGPPRSAPGGSCR